MRSAVLPRAVPTTRLIAANSLCAITGKMAGLLGVVLVLGLRVVDPRAVLLVAAGLHMLSAYGYLSWRIELGGGFTSASSMRDLAVEVRALRRLPAASRIVPAALALRTMQGATALAAVAAASQQRSSATINATMLGIVATGTFTGTVLAPNLAARSKGLGRTHRAATWLTVLSVSGVALLPGLAARLAVLLVVSVGFGIARVQADSVVQSAVAEHALGRTLATYDACYQVAFVAGAAFVGAAQMAAPAGFPRAGAIAVAAIAIAAPLLSNRLRSNA
jgi:hypothetical protein